MVDKNDQARLDELRQRLYSRGETVNKHNQFSLKDEPISVPKTWDSPRKTDIKPPVELKNEVPFEVPETAHSTPPVIAMPTSKRKSYRLKMLLAGLFFFVASVGISSLFIMFGGRAISGENISISITGPFTIGGGETIPLQIGITNQNTVPIESATLVVEYPLGTQTDNDESRELFVDRLPLNVIASGEAVNIPLRARVFGEENQELVIRASVEYRVAGSNATFYKEAEPLRFKISSSPVVLKIDSVRNISSGQEAEVKLTISSNAPNILRDILVKAEYPKNFDFSKSSPASVSGQNVWLIDELVSGGSKTITITGVLTGADTDASVMNFSVGIPNERDRFSLASVYAVANTEFVIEQPFIDIGVVVNRERNSTASISSGSISNVSLEIKNTLSSIIYDAVAEIKLSGNALSDTQVDVNNGYYDSNTRTIIWDISSVASLEKIVPGNTVNLSFTLKPDQDTSMTPQINLDAQVRARRVFESSAQESIIGSVKSVIKVQSSARLSAETGYNSALFTDTGPIPPVVGETTTYTLTMAVNNGSNQISNTVTTATLPTYVVWLDKTSGMGSFTYNPSTREVEWKAGTLAANTSAVGAFQVSLLPSVSQIGNTPILVGEQRMRADDNFTGTVVRGSSPSLTTRLPASSGYANNSGVVQAN